MINVKQSKISFIGMSGVGKTSFGKKIAKAIQYSFIDTDTVIEKEIKCSIVEFLKKEGEKRFRELEEQCIIQLNIPVKCIISTGGSVIYSNQSMNYLVKHTHIVYLKDTLENIKKRIPNINKRGIVMNRQKTLIDLYEQRKVLYEHYAHQTIAYPSLFHHQKLLSFILKELE